MQDLTQEVWEGKGCWSSAATQALGIIWGVFCCS
jgi:hypothetical protein